MTSLHKESQSCPPIFDFPTLWYWKSVAESKCLAPWLPGQANVRKHTDSRSQIVELFFHYKMTLALELSDSSTQNTH